MVSSKMSFAYNAYNRLFIVTQHTDKLKDNPVTLLYDRKHIAGMVWAHLSP